MGSSAGRVRALRVMMPLAAVVSAAGLAPARAAGVAPRPNVVFILIDDLRYNALGYSGHPFVKTPNIDRVAKEGATFRNAFVTTPLCSPSRASLLTGRYAHAHGVTDNGDHDALSHRLVTFPRLLHDAGYETAYLGKWHMGSDDSPRPGFDHWVSFRGQGDYVDPVINEDGRSRATPGYLTDILTDRAVAFLRRGHTRPFLLYLAHKAVHGPFTPAERHKALYADETILWPPSADDDLAGKPALRRHLDRPRVKGRVSAKAKARGVMRGPGDRMIRNQLRVLQAADESVGRVLRALEQTNHLDDTLVVFTGDNGFLWGDHGLVDKRVAYEESIRVPLLVRYPPLVKPGTTVDALVLNVDLAPTLLDLGVAPTPPGVHGRSLVPLLRGEAAAAARWGAAFLAEYALEPAYPLISSWQAVRDARWKYVRYTDLDGMDELYDLQADPHEMNNLADDPAARPELARLKAGLGRLLRETSGGPGGRGPGQRTREPAPESRARAHPGASRPLGHRGREPRDRTRG